MKFVNTEDLVDGLAQKTLEIADRVAVGSEKHPNVLVRELVALGQAIDALGIIIHEGMMWGKREVKE